MAYSTALGLMMMLGSLGVFALLLPRKGMVNPLIRNDGIQTVVLMALILVFFLGGTLALMGFPTGVYRSQ